MCDVIIFSRELKWANQKAATPNYSAGHRKGQDGATGSR